MTRHPYRDLPNRAFWKRAVSFRHYEDMDELWEPPELTGSEKFATAGSCFAQHIGRHVSNRGADNYLDLEPAPLLVSDADKSRFGYGLYTCRYGNIYTSRQLVQLTREALGHSAQRTHVWKKDGRYYDALRPTVDPVGLESAELVRSMRRLHLEKVREMFHSLDVMVFTLGLTETWLSPEDGTAFPSAPGVVAGNLDDNPAVFHNLSIDEVRSDMEEFWRLLKEVNPTARMILTVSPVPLIATASDSHVLPATTYSKSVLRVAAQSLVDVHDEVSYFPSFEIVNSPQGRGYYFDPDLRSVNDRGVQYVMSHFFSGGMARAFPPAYLSSDSGDVVCDEERIEARVVAEKGV